MSDTMKTDWNGIKPPGNFFRFSFANLLTVILLAFMAAGWWATHETKSATADTLQSETLKEHGERFDRNEKRIEELNATQKAILLQLQDLTELKIKFRIMVELVDGAKTKPELHK